MAFKFANNFKTTLAGAVPIGQAFMDVQAGLGALLEAQTGTLSTSPDRRCRLTMVRRSGGVETGWEIVDVTSVSGDRLNLDMTGSRHKEQSSSIAWNAGEIVECRLTRDVALSFIGAYTAKYDSGEQVFAGGSTFGPFAHGLPGTPELVTASIRCVAPDGSSGFSVGDVVELNPSISPSSAGISQGLYICRDASNISFGVGVNGIGILTKTSPSLWSITPSSWLLRVRAAL